jgi:hypothetical protein
MPWSLSAQSLARWITETASATNTASAIDTASATDSASATDTASATDSASVTDTDSATAVPVVLHHWHGSQGSGTDHALANSLSQLFTGFKVQAQFESTGPGTASQIHLVASGLAFNLKLSPR